MVVTKPDVEEEEEKEKIDLFDEDEDDMDEPPIGMHLFWV